MMRRRLPASALGGTVAATLLVAALGLAGGPRPVDAPDTRQPQDVQTPTQVLRLAAQRVAVMPELTARLDQFVYTESVVVTQSLQIDGRRIVLYRSSEPMVVRQWRSVDGSRDGLTRERPLGSPTGAWHDEVIPGCHNSRHGGAAGQRDTSQVCEPHAGLDGSLPTDGDAMYAYLYRPAGDDASEAYAATTSADERALVRAANALYLGQSSPAVQAAVFTAMGRIPGVRVQAGVADVVGRSGVALVYAGEDGQTQLVFDSATFQYLGVNREIAPLTRTAGSLGYKVVVHIVARQAVQRTAIVDTVGSLP